MLPVNSTIDVTRLLISLAFESLNGKEKQLDAQISRMKIEADTYLEELRIEVRMNEVNAQKELYLSLIELSKHAYDRKMDFFVKAFGDFNALIAQHQTVLLDELKALRQKEFTIGLTDLDKIQLFKSRAEINKELQDLKKMNAIMTCEFNTRVSSLSPEIRLSIPGL
ncbi:MAG: hypothetical protein ACXVB6_05975 [Mucilaginibacter sp.]